MEEASGAAGEAGVPDHAEGGLVEHPVAAGLVDGGLRERAVGGDAEVKDDGALPAFAAGLGRVALDEAGEVGDKAGLLDAGGGAGGGAGRPRGGQRDLGKRGRVGRG